jgi:rare lipoprotein A
MASPFGACFFEALAPIIYAQKSPEAPENIWHFEGLGPNLIPMLEREPNAGPGAKMRKTALLSFLVIASGCCFGTATARPTRPTIAPHFASRAFFVETGRASYYGRKHDGKMTAEGVSFDRMAFTAAHPTLAFGTVVRITILANGRTVKVRISDRGPHIEGRIIDLSAAAAREIGMQRRGVARVRIRAFRSDSI